MNWSRIASSWLLMGVLATGVIAFGVGMVGCYTMLTHPVVAEPMPARRILCSIVQRKFSLGEAQASSDQISCTACHNVQYDHAQQYHHYWDDWGWYPSYYYGYIGWNRYYWRPWWYDYNYPPYWWYNPGGGSGGSPGEPPSKREIRASGFRKPGR